MTLRVKNRIRASARRALVAVHANHVAARLLLGAHDALASRSIRPCGALQALKKAIDGLPGQLFRLAGYLDDKAPCPNCGRPEALVHLATLKTYCWDCSYWGHDPRAFAEEIERESRDLDRSPDKAQT